MTQTHYAQFGTFHITTSTRNGVPWLTLENMPQIIIDNLLMTKNIYKTKLFAFNILPTHMHIVLSIMERGLSKFMQSFKSNCISDLRAIYPVHKNKTRNVTENLNMTVTESRGFPLRDNGGIDSTQIENPNMNVTENLNMTVKESRGFPLRNSNGIKPAQILWQKGFYDEHIQSPQQLANAIRYVQYNAYNHQLVENPYDWDWSSLQFPNLIDEMDIWMD